MEELASGVSSRNNYRVLNPLLSMASADAFREQICCFGDSITQHGSSPFGWLALLQELYRRKADVFNRGYSGYNTRNARHMCRFLFDESSRTNLFSTVFFGANDAADPAFKPDQHCSLEEYTSNLRDVVAAARLRSRVVVVIAPPPVDAARWPDRTLEKAAQYGAAAKAVVEEAQSLLSKQGCGRVLFLDTLAAFTTANLAEVLLPVPKPPSTPGAPPSGAIIQIPPPCGPLGDGDPAWFAYLSDGLHLSPAGNRLLFNRCVVTSAQRATDYYSIGA